MLIIYYVWLMKVFFLFIFLLPGILLAQDRTMDSLKLVLKNAKHDTTRVKTLLNIGEEIYQIEPDTAIIFFKRCIELTEKCAFIAPTKTLKKFYFKQQAAALNNIGFLAQLEGDIPKALEFYYKGLKVLEEINDKDVIATLLHNIGGIYDSQGNIPQALDVYHRSLKIMEEINDKNGIATSLNAFGYIYQNQSDLPQALDYFIRSLKIREEIKDKNGIAISLNNIGFIYNLQGDLPKALDFYNRSLKIREEINDKNGIAVSLNNIGGVYRKMAERPDNKVRREQLLNKSLEFFHKSLKVREKSMDKKGIALSSNNIGHILLTQGKVDEAFIYATRSMSAAEQLGFPGSIKNAAFLLKNIYRKQNKFKQAFEMYELETQMRDSISNSETKKASVKKQFQYEYEKKAAADSVKNAEEQKVKNVLLTAQQAQLKQEKTQRFALYGGLVLVIAFSGFVFNRFKVTQKQKVIIEQQKVLVDDAFAHLEEKNKEVLDSIRYAKRIQTALLTSEKYIHRKLNELNS